MAKKIIIRSDANSEIGMGHLARDIELAKKLSECGENKVVFLAGGGDRRALDFITHQGGFEYIEVPPEREDVFLHHFLSRLSPRLSIVDVLARDSEEDYMNIFSRYSHKVAAITDDSYPRFIKADVVFNGNPNQKKLYYQNTNGTSYYLGPEFFILDSAFAQAHAAKKEIRKEVKNIFIAFGGADTHNAPLLVAKAIDDLSITPHLNILLSPVYNHLKKLKKFLQHSSLHYRLLSQVTSIIPFLTDADLMFCSGGNICFEASAAGVPLILINQVKRQNEIASMFAKKTSSKNLGMASAVSQDELQKTISALIDNQALRQKMSTHQKKLVDGRGVERVAEIIMKLTAHST